MKNYIYKSRGERLVASILEEINCEFFYELPFKGIKPDFCIINNGKKYFIEYNGRQHYVPVRYFGGIISFIKQIYRDLYEYIICKKDKIPLLRIKYSLTDSEIKDAILKFLNK